MTREEASYCLKAYKDPKLCYSCPYYSGSFKPCKNNEAHSMAIKSLEAWDKVETEIKNDWMFKKYPSAPYTCGLRDSLEIINKYLKEVKE